LADAHKLIGNKGTARAAYELALQRTPESEPIQRAHLCYKLATLIDWTEATEAWHLLDVAEAALGDHPLEPTNDWWATQLNVQMRRAMLHYWRSEPQEMNDWVSRIRPDVEAHGTPEQRSWLFGLLGNTGFALDRFVPTARTLQYCEASLAAAQETGNPQAVSDAQFRMGFALLWLGRLDEAEASLRASQEYAQSAGIVRDQLLCLTYLTILSRKRQRVQETKNLALQSLELAHQAEVPHYVVASRGALAWVAWREGDVSRAEKEGRMALQIWQEPETTKYPLMWTAFWPLIGVALSRRELGLAMDYVDLLLDEQQQRLPEPMTAALQAATTAWDEGRRDEARQRMDRAVAIAADLGYL
jgi:tetratricopeptide (TPR) repeat protein